MNTTREELLAEFEAFEKENPPFQKSTDQFGETAYRWENHKHPDNPNFQQVVFWRAWQKPDGRYSIGYRLTCLGDRGKIKFIEYGNGDVEAAIQKYL